MTRTKSVTRHKLLALLVLAIVAQGCGDESSINCNTNITVSEQEFAELVLQGEASAESVNSQMEVNGERMYNITICSPTSTETSSTTVNNTATSTEIRDGE